MTISDGQDTFKGKQVTGDKLDTTSAWHGSVLPTNPTNEIPTDGIFILEVIDGVNNPGIYKNIGSVSAPNFSSIAKFGLGADVLFGDGFDGDFTTPVGPPATTTLTETKYFDDLTIAPGTTLTAPQTMIIFVKGVLTVDGTINMDGLGGSGGSAGSIGPSAGGPPGSPPGGGGGSGSAGSAAGGSGGAGGGTAVILANTIVIANGARISANGLAGANASNNPGTSLNGSNGGGGVGTLPPPNVAPAGGGGGGGGGTSGEGGAGGTGGNGGLILLYTTSLTDNNPSPAPGVQALGGAAGLGGSGAPTFGTGGLGGGGGGGGPSPGTKGAVGNPGGAAPPSLATGSTGSVGVAGTVKQITV